jgi:PBP1b-binding outer membrane lipoprotein LpoB
MLKKSIVLLVILSVFLVACQSAATEPPAEPAAESPVEPDTAGTELPPLPEVSPTPDTQQATDQAEANCTVVSRQPPAGSTEPLVTDNDWTQGPDDATVTFIEYSDFQ